MKGSKFEVLQSVSPAHFSLELSLKPLASLLMCIHYSTVHPEFKGDLGINGLPSGDFYRLRSFPWLGTESAALSVLLELNPLHLVYFDPGAVSAPSY